MNLLRLPHTRARLFDTSGRLGDTSRVCQTSPVLVGSQKSSLATTADPLLSCHRASLRAAVSVICNSEGISVHLPVVCWHARTVLPCVQVSTGAGHSAFLEASPSSNALQMQICGCLKHCAQDPGDELSPQIQREQVSKSAVSTRVVMRTPTYTSKPRQHNIVFQLRSASSGKVSARARRVSASSGSATSTGARFQT